MAKAKFRFQLQPALDAAEAEQSRAERELIEARNQLAEAEALLTEREAEVQETVQQIAEAHDHLTDPSRATGNPMSFQERDEQIKALRLIEARRREAADKQRGEVAFRQERVESRKRALAEAMGKRQALDKLKDKARQEHKRALDRKLQDDIDEAGILRSSREP